MSLGRVRSWMLFRKTYGNFCFNTCYGVSLFHLATGNVGRGKMEKDSGCLPANLVKRGKLGSVFFHEGSCWRPLPSSAMSEPSSAGSWEWEIPSHPGASAAFLG